MTKKPVLHETLTGSIIGAYYEVYNKLGYGYLEFLHLAAMEIELRDRGHRVARELSVNVYYKQREIGCQRLDMVIDDLVVVEAKSTEKLPPNASRQLFNYLRCTNLEVGLLLHFGPEPSFFRVVCDRGQKESSADRLHPSHPSDPSPVD
jgi:GxxExxY protein